MGQRDRDEQSRCTRHRALAGEDVSLLLGRICSECRTASDRFHQAAKRTNRAIWQGRPCANCGAPATGGDHIVPYSLGGTNDPANRQALCNRCNTSKGAKMTGAPSVRPAPTMHYLYSEGRNACPVYFRAARATEDASAVTCGRCLRWMTR